MTPAPMTMGPGSATAPRRGRPPQSLPSTVVAQRRGGRSTDALVRARRLLSQRLLPDLAAAPARIEWPLPKVMAQRETELARVIGDDIRSREERAMIGLRSVFRSRFQHDDFREIQASAILEFGVRRRDTVVVWRTGGGKTALYAVPSMFPKTLTIVIEPLIALLEDQLRVLTSRGIYAVALHSQMTADEIDRSMRELWRTEAINVLLLSAEKVVYNPQVVLLFRQLKDSGRKLRFVVDEAHCVLEWGEFRPAYRMLDRLKAEFPEAPVMAMTATATVAEAHTIAALLGMRAPSFVRGQTDRPELAWVSEPARAAYASKYAANLCALLETHHRDQSGIVYVASPNTAERVARILNEGGFVAAAFHSKVPNDERRRILDHWINGRIRIVVGTSAFGMGIDMPSCRFVVNLQAPTSLTSLQQQSGRAGRDGSVARVYLFTAAMDERTWGIIFGHSARELIQTERRRSGEPPLEEAPLQEQVSRRSSANHQKLREVMCFSKTSVCLRWALEVGMARVFAADRPISLCDTGKQACSNCEKGHVGAARDVAPFAALMLAIIRLRPGLTADDLVDVFTLSKAKRVSSELTRLGAHESLCDLRARLSSRPTAALGDYCLDALVVLEFATLRVIAPDMPDPEDDETQQSTEETQPPPQGTQQAPQVHQRARCIIQYWPSVDQQEAPRNVFCHKQ